MKVGLEKIENCKRMTVKVLLDSGATGLFINTKFAKEKKFKLERLKNPLLVRNMNRTINMGEAITHQVKCNIFFKKHVEKARIDVCNLGKIEVILGIPQLAVHNPEIDWKKEEVKMIQCLPICRKRKQKTQKKRQVKKIEKGKTVKELVSRRFWKQKKVFEKEKSERIPTRKLWNHTIELKEGFVLKKEKVYSLSREKREKVQAFVEDQL